VFLPISRKSILTLLCLGLCLLAASCTPVERYDNPGFSRVDNIPKSPNDSRRYRAVMLDNGLRVMLVSDPETDKAAASMDVNAGSNADPAAFEGLAHFLEHMLFLGTDKYPASGEYQEFISTNGGSHNAYTAFENTNYFFDVEKDALAPALDRFAQFFIAPLFNEEYVNRERNAVHSEYQSNLQSDGRRSYSIFKQVINQEHPLAQFSVGNLDTLMDKPEGELRQALLDHYQRYYSANLMSLAIYGAESLDELETMARDYFSAVKNREVTAPRTDQPLFLEGQLPMLLEIQPVRDTRTLGYTFPIPVVREFYREKPLNYIANLLGHEGQGSLLALLKEKGWANGLSAGGGISYADNATFSVNIALTEAGVARIDDITSLLFSYIALVRDEGIQQWLFNEQKTMADISFTFQEPGGAVNTASALARGLQLYSPGELLTVAYDYQRYDPLLYREILDYLVPENLLLTFTSKNVRGNNTDPWFGGQYSVMGVPDPRVREWHMAEDTGSLSIPAPNPFLPDNLDVRDVAGTGPGGPENKPTLIMDEAGMSLWFRHDNEYQVPRANFYVYALTPLLSDSLENSLLSNLAISLMNDKLNAYSYPANLAGLFYGVTGRARGFSIRLGGYNDKQGVLLEEVLETLSTADFEQERFDIIRTEMIRALENSDIRMPYVRLSQKAQALLVSPYWSEEERIRMLETLTLDDVIAFVPRMLRDVNLQGFYHGNVLGDEARAMMAIVSRYLQVTEESLAPPFGRVMNLDPGVDLVMEDVIDHEDSAIVMYLQGPDDSLETRARIALLAAILRTPFFDSLRTEQQLGYVVSAGAMPILDTSGLRFTIESPVAGPVILEQRIVAFLKGFEADLAAMPNTMFESIRGGVLNSLRQSPQSLRTLSGRFWSDILVGEYDSDSTLAMAAAIESTSLADVQAYYRDYVLGEEARKLVARSAGRPHREAFLERARSEVGRQVVRDVIDEINAYKEEAQWYIFRP